MATRNPASHLRGDFAHDEMFRLSDTVPVVFRGGAWDGAYSELREASLRRPLERRVGILGHDVYVHRGEWEAVVPEGTFKVPGVLMAPRPRRSPAAVLRHVRFVRRGSPLEGSPEPVSLQP